MPPVAVRLAIIQRYFPHYRKPVFDGLWARPGIALSLLYGLLQEPRADLGISQPAPPMPYTVPLGNRYLPGTRLMWQSGALRHTLSGACDVVILEGDMHILSNVAILLLARFRRVPVLLWLKGWWGDGAGEASLGGGLRGVVRRLFLGLADGVVCYGESTRRQFQAGGLAPDRLFVAQNTVMVETLTQPAANAAPMAPEVERLLASPRPYVFTIGRMVRDKRIPELIRSFVAAGLGKVDLVVAGDGPERDAVAAAAKGYGNVHVVGPVSDADADRLLLRAMACAFPGAVGLAVNQAMAAGGVVLCADEPGPDSEIVVDGVNGIRLPHGDEAAWTGALGRVAADAALRSRLGAAARETVIERATVGRMVSGLENAARSILRLREGR